MDYFFNFDKLSYVQSQKSDACILCLVRDSSPNVADLTVYRSMHFIISLNLYPFNSGHLLVFPKRHVIDIRELSIDERHDMDDTIDKALVVLDSQMKPTAYNIGCNMGLTAGASIDHLHWHIIPRYPREIGIAELIAGKRVLLEHPLDTRDKLLEAFRSRYAV